MSISVKVKKGLDLHLAGAVDQADIAAGARECPVARVALCPDDFYGLVPKMEVKEGDAVRRGQPLFHDKAAEAVKVVSPLQGVVKAVVRGARRKIERVEVEAQGPTADGGTALAFPKEVIVKALADGGAARALLQQAGLWALMRQRPYDIVPEAAAHVRDIFVTGFDSAPLAVSRSTFTPADVKTLEAGVSILRPVTPGKVYISRRPGQGMPDIKGAEMVDMEGPHPSSLAGTVIGAVAPVNKGETVLTLDLELLMRAGSLVLAGEVPSVTVVAVTGSEVRQPCLVRTLVGAPLADILGSDVKADGRHHRVIAGNVLTGVLASPEGYLRWPYRQVTVIPEGDDVAEFMGWASLSPSKMSRSASFPSHFLHKKLFNPDARLQGGRRAMIMSGEYDSVTPLDILPEYLLKAILARDIDRMEQLGIYEVAPEDFALAEYADTSKLEVQRIVREGLDFLRKELQ